MMRGMFTVFNLFIFFISKQKKSLLWPLTVAKGNPEPTFDCLEKKQRPKILKAKRNVLAMKRSASKRPVSSAFPYLPRV